jgi:hypothetical protein
LPELVKHYERSELRAMSAGSLWPTIAHETSRAMESTDYMHGVNTADKMMRIHADIAARFFAEDALKGGKAELAKARELGINPRDPRFVDKMAKALTDETQFRTDAPHMPLWTKTVQGKLATQYLSFAYQHTRYLMDLGKHPIKNFGKIARLAAVGAVIGEGIGSTKAGLRAIIPGKDEESNILNRMIEGIKGDPSFDTKPYLKKLQAVTQSKRIPIDSPWWRALQNLANIGGAGLFQTALERAFDPSKNLGEKVASAVGGPVGSHLIDFGKAAGKDIMNAYKESDYAPENTARWGLQQTPYMTGLSPYKFGNYVIPPETYRRRHHNRFQVRPPKF